MDLSLWDPPICEDESSDFGENWVSDFFGHERDVIEEDAINEQCCTHVLKVDHVSQTHGEPAPKLTEILKPLLANYYLNKDEQNPSSNAEKLAAPQSNDETKLSNLEEISGGAKTSEETVGPLFSEAPKTDMKEKDPNGDTIVTDAITEFSTQASDVSTQKDMNAIDSSIQIGEGIGIYDSTTKAEKGMYAAQLDEQANIVMINPSLNALISEAGSNSGEGSIQIGEGIGIYDSTTNAEKGMYTAQFVEQANAVMINPSVNALISEAGPNSGKGRCNQQEMYEGVVQSFKIESINKMPPQKPNETTIVEADMFADMASDYMSDDVNQIVSESILKKKFKMLADADRTNKIDTPRQLVRREMMRIESPHKQIEPWLPDSKPTIGASLLELLSNKNNEARKPLIKMGQKPIMPKEMQTSEVVGTGAYKSNLLFKSGMPELTGMHFSPFDSNVVQEPSLAMEMELKHSSIKNFKRDLMSRMFDGNAVKNYASERINETHLDFGRNKSYTVASGVSINAVCEPPEKRNKWVISPMINRNEELMNLLDIPKIPLGSMNALAKEDDEQITNFHAAKDAGVRPLKLLSCTTSLATVDLNSLPLSELRAMAKERKLTRYSKLKKSDLIKLLEE